MKTKDLQQRTMTQNRALHKYFSLLAETLNDAGLDQRKVLKPSIEIPWSPDSIKEMMWRPIQKSMVEKESTTELTTTELQAVFKVMDRHLLEKFGVDVPFPSDEYFREEMV